MQANRMKKAELDRHKVESTIDRIKGIRVGIIGDGCLDIYLDVDMRLSELSRETPHYPLPVLNERMYPGGGTNVALNVKDLGVAHVYMLSVIGRDWRGQCLMSKLHEKNINTQFMIESEDRITPAYCKPMIKGHSDLVYEDSRIDFENRAPLSKGDETNIIKNLQRMSDKVDVIAVCDQFNYGIINQKIRAELEKLALQGKKIVVDSRSRIGLFRNVIIKPNDIEVMVAAYNADLPEINMQTIMEGTIKLYKLNKAPIIVTMGDKGSIWYDGTDFYMADIVQVDPPIDIVGAGDAFLAAFTSAFGSGFTGYEAIAFGNLVSSIVIQKIGMAGTATPNEVVKQLGRLDI